MSKPAPARPAKLSAVQQAYFNRELSWLAFNRRVLEQAEDVRYPLLERLRFLAFVSSNLDEFFEIRVAGLMQQIESGITQPSLDGLEPKEQLRRIHSVAASLVQDQYACWMERVVPALADEGIVFKNRQQLTRGERAWLRTHFTTQVQPVLTPLAIDPAHPFPAFANKSLNLLLWLDDPDTPETERMMAFVPVPRILPRVICIPGRGRRTTYIFLSEALKLFARELFPGYKVISVHAFRLTRNSDLYIDEEEVENLLQSIQQELHNRRKGEAVRLEIEEGVEDALLDKLLTGVHLGRQHVFHVPGPINLLRLMAVHEMIDRPDLKFPPFHPHTPPALRPGGNIYEVIRAGDVLLHHPYESFEPVIDFVRQAAIDPRVLAIKITLYRTNSDSPIVKALIDAARANKQVTALIELKARFDEANNISWAKRLEEAGVHVVYGFVRLKTHCKCCLVVRREDDGLRRYAHLGTGNYHARTATLYTDLSLLTAHERLTEEVAQVFNTLTGFAKAPQFAHLLVAPYTLHKRMLENIAQEARNAKKGLPARIFLKCNSLVERETIDALYAASRAGVQIECCVRGICGLVPGVPGMSENIRVRSLLGRYLEHSRLYYFENAQVGEPLLFCGSADWMPRNFFRRVEVIFPVLDPLLRERVLREILPPYLNDTQHAMLLRPNGAYRAVTPARGEESFSAQNHFIALAEAAARRALDLEEEDAEG